VVRIILEVILALCSQKAVGKPLDKIGENERVGAYLGLSVLRYKTSNSSIFGRFFSKFSAGVKLTPI